MAKGTHGHLAVPSEPSEGDYLLRLISSNLDENSGAWIGGRHNGRSWTWITGEPWTFASWAPDSPDGTKEVDSAVRLVAGKNGGWDDGNPRDDQAAAAFVIEWSEDRGNTRPVAADVARTDWILLPDQVRTTGINPSTPASRHIFVTILSKCANLTKHFFLHNVII